MAEAEVECSLCLSICSRICYQRRRDRYACHNRECALHYPENIEINRDSRFVLGIERGRYHPRRGDDSDRGENHPSRTSSRSHRISPENHQPRPLRRGRSPGPCLVTHLSQNSNTYRPTLLPPVWRDNTRRTSLRTSPSIPDSGDYQHREMGRRHEGRSVSTPTNAAVHLSPERRPRLLDALRTLLCGLSKSRSTCPDDDSCSRPRRNQKPWSPNRRRYSQHNSPPSRDNTPPPRNNRASSRNTRASRQTRRSRENKNSGDDNATETSTIDLPPLTRQENGCRRLYRDTSSLTRYTIFLERQGDAPMNLRSITRDREPL